MSEDLCPVMLFSGKGGVGKTTLAAATAVRLARTGSRVLIVSTDPAHSLSDVFDLPLGPHPRQVTDQLEAMEVDAEAMFSAVASVGGQASRVAGPLANLLQMASQTPGVDEFGAIEVLLQALEQADHDVVILDTAPTGHTLRLLMLPDLLDGWLGTLLQLREHFARAGRLLRRFLPGSDAATEAQLEQGLRGGRERVARLRRILSDPKRAQIFLVTIPEAMSVLETLRTLELLRAQQLAIGALIVNQIQPANDDCDHCQRRHTIHQTELAGLRERAGDVQLRLVQTLSEEIRGLSALDEMAARLWNQASTSPRDIK